ncbi:MAG: FGGY family carbohydrate kinase [[Clostridium] scindens]
MARVENYLLGMDCGTTNIKAIIPLGEDGTVVVEASSFPAGFMNARPEYAGTGRDAVVDNTVDIFRALTEKAGKEVVKRIRGISVSSHTVTMLPVDANGNPLRNALTYQDNRSAAELHYIVDQVGFDRFVSIVGGQPAVAFLPNKILWFKKNEPELFAKTACFLQASSFINYKLTGKMTMDIDQASRTQCSGYQYHGAVC